MLANMQRWKKWLIAVPAFVLCVAATQWAVKGVHPTSGGQGFLGTEDAGVAGIGNGTSAAGVVGTNTGVVGALGVTGAGVSGDGGAFGHGVIGSGRNGVLGTSYGLDDSGVGVSGSGPTGVLGTSPNGYAVRGNTTAGTAIYGVLEAGGTGHAGYFQGRVHVNGTLSKSAGSFKIDHPLDPGGKYLSHSFVESPDMKNFYDGVITLGKGGSAVVELPEWFEALNKDFRYQLTCIGEHAPVYIAEKISDNQFRIAGGYEGLEVSWAVTGIRRDAYAEAYRIPVEEEKKQHEAGRFLHPELYRNDRH